MLERRLASTLLILTLAGSGCTAAPWIQEIRLARTGLAPRDGVTVVLASPAGEEHASELETQLASCIRNGVSRVQSDIRFLPADDLAKLAPEGQSAGRARPRYLSLGGLVLDPALQGRIAPLGLRYFIVVHVEARRRLTDVEMGSGDIGLGGPRVSWSWSREALMEAVVVDTRRRRTAGAVQAYAKGRSGGGVALLTFRLPVPVPFGMTSFPLSVACQALGEALGEFLADDSRAREQTAKPDSQ